MQFYKIKAKIYDNEFIKKMQNRETSKMCSRSICDNTEEYNAKLKGELAFFVVEIMEDEVSCCAVVNKTDAFQSKIEKFFKAIKLNVKDITSSEVILDVFGSALHLSSRNQYIFDDDEILFQFGLAPLTDRCGRSFDYDEFILEDTSKDKIEETIHKNLLDSTFLPEIERIYGTKKEKKFFGHPVHYLIESNNKKIFEQASESLLGALYSNGRILNKRFDYADISTFSSISLQALYTAYKVCEGGAFIIRYSCADEDDGEFASSDSENIRKLCECAWMYRNKVLTILELPRDAVKIKDKFMEQLPNLCFVEIKEDLVKNDNAKDYLKMLAKENSIKTDKGLFDKIQEDKTYLSSELKVLFDEWYDVKLRTTVYSQYKDITNKNAVILCKKTKGSSYNELMSMTGLTEAKEVINRALDYFKVQKLFKEKGMHSDHPSMHMVFTGNPGSAKTTCARLFAEIMKENELLSKGHLVEVGRSDLVGKFVGHTAPLVKRKFREAKGGVLFIDEAYSLVDDRNGLFGDEAINTIVQEMENNREDLVVVFAGYPDKMDAFLDKNPGLRSRIAFHIPFNDYDVSDLCNIAEHIAREKGFCLTKDAMEKLEDIFVIACRQKDFGNGRFVRNILEKARMAQASRLLLKDFNYVTKDDIATITAQDIDEPKQCTKVSAEKRIGFCV